MVAWTVVAPRRHPLGHADALRLIHREAHRPAPPVTHIDLIENWLEELTA